MCSFDVVEDPADTIADHRFEFPSFVNSPSLVDVCTGLTDLDEHYSPVSVSNQFCDQTLMRPQSQFDLGMPVKFAGNGSEKSLADCMALMTTAGIFSRSL